MIVGLDAGQARVWGAWLAQSTLSACREAGLKIIEPPMDSNAPRKRTEWTVIYTHGSHLQGLGERAPRRERSHGSNQRLRDARISLLSPLYLRFRALSTLSSANYDMTFISLKASMWPVYLFDSDQP